MLKIAITGASGFIGSNFLRSFQANYLILGRKVDTIQELSVCGQQTFYFWDFLSNAQDINLAEVPVLLHFASSLNMRSSPEEVEKNYEVEFFATKQLFENYISQNPNGKIIFLSSGGALYDNRLKEPKAEDKVIANMISSPYGALKYRIENMLEQLTSSGKSSGYSLRVGNPYGELLNPNRRQGLIGIAGYCLINDLPLSIFENENSMRDYIHVFDLNMLLSKIISKKNDGSYHVYNVASGIGMRTIEILEQLELTFNKKFKVQLVGQSLIPTYNILDIDKAKSEFDWSPSIDLKRGISLMFGRIN